MKLRDLTGKKFGRLTVIELVKTKKMYTSWKCICECGREHTVIGTNLTSGKIKSCGCLGREVVSSDKMILKYENILYDTQLKIDRYRKTQDQSLIDNIQKVQQAINKLDERAQKFIILRYFERKQAKYIMEVFGLRITQVYRIRKKAIIDFTKYYENLI